MASVSSGNRVGLTDGSDPHLNHTDVMQRIHLQKCKAVQKTELTIEQESKTLICISFTKLNIHLLLERVFLNFSGYPLILTEIQANATKRLHQFRNRFHFSRDTKRIYEKTCYSHASSVVSTVTQVLDSRGNSMVGNWEDDYAAGTERVQHLQNNRTALQR
ncbi:hypothetical protein CSKR_101065 [Clonorchis sinensis]|uniref:Uncharacterized protein n=1 Tax=Clonorchis sinensis TaxID=79923 RepID=A0A419QHT7_CLOSI|nr:hypothetical protein CSKR_101065 [Clonorchis sinensis]